MGKWVLAEFVRVDIIRPRVKLALGLVGILVAEIDTAGLMAMRLDVELPIPA